MTFLHAAKKKTLLPLAKQTAKVSPQKFEELMKNNPILRDCFWEFVLDVDNLVKWEDESIAILLAYTSNEGFAKIAQKESLQKKLIDKKDKLIKRFPQLSFKISAVLNSSQHHGLPVAHAELSKKPSIPLAQAHPIQKSIALKTLEQQSQEKLFNTIIFWGAILSLCLWLTSGFFIAALTFGSAFMLGKMRTKAPSLNQHTNAFRP